MFDVLAIVAGLLISPAQAANQTCPTRPVGDSSNACANTRFVQNSVGNPNTISVLSYATCDGVSDDTVGIQNATNAAVAAGKALLFNNIHDCVTGAISGTTNTTWIGTQGSPTLSRIRLKAGSTTGIFVAGNAGTTTSAHFVTLMDLEFDGDAANNPGAAATDLISIYGEQKTIVNVKIKNAKGNALVTNFDVATAGNTYSVYDFYSHIDIDTVGRACWIHLGGPDARGDAIHGTDCSLESDGGYEGFTFQSDGRWSDIHYSCRNATVNTPSSGVLINSAGNTFDISHFECGHIPLVINATANTIMSSSFYAPRSGLTVDVIQGYNIISGTIGIGAASGFTTYTGIKLESPWNIVDLVTSNTLNGAVLFAAGDAHNVVRLRGGNGTGAGYAGSPDATDQLDIDLFTATNSKLYQNPNPVANSGLATMAANTAKSNFTGSTAAPTDFAMPSCADATGHHLNYVSGTGVTCGTSSITDGAWSSYTPTVTYTGTGTVTRASWKQLGTKTLAVNITFNITAQDGSTVIFSLPTSTATATAACTGLDNLGVLRLTATVGASGIELVSPNSNTTYYISCGPFEIN